VSASAGLSSLRRPHALCGYQALQGPAPGSQPAIPLRLWAGEFASNHRGAQRGLNAVGQGLLLWRFCGDPTGDHAANISVVSGTRHFEPRWYGKAAVSGSCPNPNREPIGQREGETSVGRTGQPGLC